MLIATTNDLPGWTIEEVLGEVFGLTVRSRNAIVQFGAGIQSMFGGEVTGMTQAVIDSRNEVVARMSAAAEARGGDAIVAMRFDTASMSEVWTEVCAYGTAVRATKLP